MTAATAPPVLLVHGFASSFEHNWLNTGWVDVLEDAGRSVIGLDLPGHGNADRSHDPADYAGVEDRVLAAMADHLVVDAVGFSAGALILLRLAAREPARFRRLVLVGIGSNAVTPQDPEPMVAALTREPDSADVTGMLMRRLAESAGNDPLALVAFLRRQDRGLTARDLGHVTVPVLVVIGEHDFAAPADSLVDELPDSRLLVLSGLDHFATPGDLRCIQAALDFLEE